jgi:hypothetical protein
MRSGDLAKAKKVVAVISIEERISFFIWTAVN